MKFSNILIVLTLLLVGCKDPEPADPVPQVTTLNNGMLVLCEGLFQHNNSSVSWVNLDNGGIDPQFFQTKTNRGLGDTGNDLQRYGGKIYVVVNVSSTIEVMDAGNFQPIKQISMQANGQSKQPRSLAFANGNAYVTCYDGYVDVIDTASLTITTRIQVGANPEGLAVANGKLYVANSGGLNFPNVDSTVSVIDLNTHTELSKITVGQNPGAVLATASGDVFVIARGNYGSIPSRLKRIDPVTDQLVNTFPFNCTGIAPMDDQNMLVFDETSVSRYNFLLIGIDHTYPLDLSNVTTMYNVAYRSSDNMLYVMDAMNYTNSGYVRQYTLDGTLVQSFNVGLNPSKILFYD